MRPPKTADFDQFRHARAVCRAVRAGTAAGLHRSVKNARQTRSSAGETGRNAS